MPGTSFEPWEPEETVGKLWHAIASRLDTQETYDEAAVMLDEVRGRLAVFFRGVGGDRSVEIREATPERSQHRLSFRRSLVTVEERMARATLDGEVLRLPESIAVFPDRDANLSLYFWLAASAAHAPALIEEDDALRADLRSLAAASRMIRETVADCPGLRHLYNGLAAACLAARPKRTLPRWEAAVEQVITALLGKPVAPDGPASDLLQRILSPEPDLAEFEAPLRYRPFMPVPLWPDLRPLALSADSAPDQPEAEGDAQEAGEGTHRARRNKSDETDRKDSLILHRFEAILSWAEFLNLNRKVDDDDPEGAKKAADDLDEIALGQISKAPATRLKLHLDLAPEDVHREHVSGAYTYPEWNVRSGSYLPDYCRVLVSDVEPPDESELPVADARARRRSRAVKRQFEALRPRRVVLPGQPDGDDLDLDATVRSRVELLATGRGTNRIWRSARSEERDLAVSILLDVSRSTESAVTGRAVIDIEREALAAFAWGLDACGDDFAIHAFSSLRHDRVYVQRCKGFSEPMSAAIDTRIASLRPGFYTRLGAAIRHVSADLGTHSRQRRLLIAITDGKPNDLDHYEGRYGIEDSRMAIREARRAGQSVFGIAIDAKGKSWFPRIFGRGGYAVIPDPDRLVTALPDIYRHLVGA